MTTLSSLVQVRHRSARSVNLELDLSDPQVLDGYVVAESAVELVERLGASTKPGVATRAWSVTGPYGAGKSSAAHLLASTVASSSDPVSDAAMRVADSDPRLKQAVEGIREIADATGRGCFRAVASARREPIGVVIERALLLGARNYWRGAGRRPKLLLELERMAADAGQGGARDSARLLSALDQMQKIAPVILIIDEFGKCLDYAAEQPDDGDLFLLQEIAERFSNSTNFNGAVITLQHLAFSDYASRLSGARRREWNKVQGRFDDLAFFSTDELGLQLIGGSLEMPESDGAARVTDAVNALISELGEDLPPHTLGALKAVAPLHPVTAVALARITERVGQHGRSVVAFMTSEASDALPELLATIPISDSAVVRPSALYDHFIASAVFDLSTGEDGARLRELRARLASAPDLSPLAEEIAKTAGVLNIVAPEGDLRASKRMLELSILGPSLKGGQHERFDEALAELVDAGVLTYRGFADEYRVWKGSDLDIARIIGASRDRLGFMERLDAALVAKISEVRAPPSLVARRHSQTHHVLRYFNARYELSLDELCPAAEGADGLLVYLFASLPPESAPSKDEEGRPIVVITSPDGEAVTQSVLDALAVLDVLSSGVADADPVARRELELRAVQADAHLSLCLEEAFDPSRSDVVVHARRSAVKLGSARGLTQLLSDLCDEAYPKTPRIASEMLNRRELTSQGSKARRELIEALVLRPTDEQFGLDGGGPEVSLYKTLLAEHGFHRRAGESENWELHAPLKRSSLYPAWELITQFLLSSAQEPRPVSELFDLLALPPYGIKSGPMPVLLAIALCFLPDEVFVYQDGTFQPVVGPEHFERLVRFPERFSVQHAPEASVMKSISVELGDLITGSAQLPAAARNKTTLSIVRPLVSLVNSLPGYSRDTTSISAQAAAVRRVLVEAREPDQLLLRDLPDACGLRVITENSSRDEVQALGRVLSECLEELTNAYPSLLEAVAIALHDAFVAAGSVDSLREDLRSRSRSLSKTVIDPAMRSLMLAFADEHLDDGEWLEAVAMNLTQKPPTVWKDADVRLFELNAVDRARRFRRLELLHIEMRENERDGFHARRLTVTDPDGTEHSELIWVERGVVSAAEGIVEDMLNTLSNLSNDAKRAVLLELVRDVVGPGAEPDASLGQEEAS